jgi:predicted transcriptional regulator
MLARLCGDAVPEVEYLAMGPAKAALIRAIEDQPDDSSYEEILRELAFGAMVERGIADSDAGRTIPNDEMARRIESWRK